MNFVKTLRTPFLQNTSGRLLPYSEHSPNLFFNIHIYICNNLLIHKATESHHHSNKIKFLQPSTLYDIFWQMFALILCFYQANGGSEELKKCLFLLPLQSCDSWVFVKENPVRNKMFNNEYFKNHTHHYGQKYLFTLYRIGWWNGV